MGSLGIEDFSETHCECFEENSLNSHGYQLTVPSPWWQFQRAMLALSPKQGCWKNPKEQGVHKMLLAIHLQNGNNILWEITKQQQK